MEKNTIETHPITLTLREYWRRRIFIVAVAFLGGLVTMIGTLVVTPIYRSQSTFMPMEAEQGGLRSQLMGMAGSLGGLGGIMGTSQGGARDKFLAVLNSRTLTEDIINDLDLMPLIYASMWDVEKKEWKSEPPQMEPTVELMKTSIVEIKLSENNLISVAARFADPSWAARIANAYVDGLARHLKEGSFTLAKKNRLFLEERLLEAEKQMVTAAMKLEEFQANHKLVDLTAEIKIALEATAKLRAEILLRETNMSVIKGASSTQNPRYRELQREKAELTKQLHGITGNYKSEKEKEGNGAFFSFPQLTGLQRQYAHVKRNVLFAEKLNALLIEQLEMAKIDEVRSDVSFQVIDRAVIPIKRVWPARTFSTILGFLISFILALAYIPLRPTLRQLGKGIQKA